MIRNELEDDKKLERIIKNFLNNASFFEKQKLNEDITYKKISIEQVVSNINDGKYNINISDVGDCVRIIDYYINESSNQIVAMIDNDLENGTNIHEIASNIINGYYQGNVLKR